MKELLLRLWQDDDGAEIAEWVIVVALLVVVAIAIYDGILRTELTELVEGIGTKIDALSTS